MAGHPLAGFFRRDLAAMARAQIAPRPEPLMVRASTGAPGWASVPWLSIFAPHVTRSMRHGLYVVFFINARDERIVLSLQHGAAEVMTRLGPEAGCAHLRRMAAATRARAGAHRFDTAPIHLGSDAALARGYGAGCVLSREWRAEAPDLPRLPAALAAMLDLYRRLIPPA